MTKELDPRLQAAKNGVLSVMDKAILSRTASPETQARHDARFESTALKYAQAALVSSDVVAWRPISEAPQDATPIVRWHRVWRCPIAVCRGESLYDRNWIEITKSLYWPEAAFSPYFQPLSAFQPPPSDREGN